MDSQINKFTARHLLSFVWKFLVVGPHFISKKIVAISFHVFQTAQTPCTEIHWRYSFSYILLLFQTHANPVIAHNTRKERS